MAEYIEREEIRRAYEKLTRSYVNGNPYIADWRFDEMIEKLPAADVAPVRHGRWMFVEQRFYHGGFVNLFRCSECKVATDREHNFCPNCGAKMDGGAGNGC